MAPEETLTTTPLEQLKRQPMAAFPGSTAIFFQVQPGVLLKAAVKIGQDQIIRDRPSVEDNFHVEEKILQWLGPHPRIVRFLGRHPRGLLLAEASHGSLQRYLHEHNVTISAVLRNQLFTQAVEAVAFIHKRGVMHSDLRPDNFLIHETAPDSLEIQLCDFGGATCQTIDVSGHSLPDSGFLNPRLPLEPSFAVDVFSLGSVLYAISRGHWPFRTGTAPFPTIQEEEEYEARADACFGKGETPDVEGLFGGEVMRGCWRGVFSNGGEVLAAVKALR